MSTGIIRQQLAINYVVPCNVAWNVDVCMIQMILCNMVYLIYVQCLYTLTNVILQF